ncbi:hypothetical protein GQ54DRAFT_300279 [Martensiomyces pterosporus]|nr:hypothetical protein GQ54DRAFT_300279 [Martensiomyces pterosporus]
MHNKGSSQREQKSAGGIAPREGIIDSTAKRRKVAGSIHRKQHVCDLCGEEFPSIARRRSHRAWEHSKERVMALPSGIKYKFVRDQSSGGFICLCGQHLRYNSLLAHSKSCTNCHDTSVVSNLPRGKEEGHSCKQCEDAVFSTYNDLRTHVREFHQLSTTVTLPNDSQCEFSRESADRGYMCFCGSEFTYWQIKVHAKKCPACLGDAHQRVNDQAVPLTNTAQTGPRSKAEVPFTFMNGEIFVLSRNDDDGSFTCICGERVHRDVKEHAAHCAGCLDVDVPSWDFQL